MGEWFWQKNCVIWYQKKILWPNFWLCSILKRMCREKKNGHFKKYFTSITKWLNQNQKCIQERKKNATIRRRSWDFLNELRIKGDCVCSLQLGSCEYFSLNLEVNIYSTFRLDENVLFFICRILFQFYFLVPIGVTHPPVSPRL